MAPFSPSCCLFGLLASLLCGSRKVSGCEVVKSLEEIEQVVAASSLPTITFCDFEISGDDHCNGSGPDQSAALINNHHDTYTLQCASGAVCKIDCPGRHLTMENSFDVLLRVENLSFRGATSGSIWIEHGSLKLSEVVFEK